MNPTILLVDVPSSVRENWKSVLRSRGYEVFTAENGDSAMRQCLQLQPELVLLHDRLHDICGFELCRQLKGTPLTQLTPIVLIKPSHDPEYISQGREAGAADFWGSSTSLSEALGRVQSLLRLKAESDEQAKRVVLAMARSLEAKHPLTDGHSERLAGYAVQLGESLGLADEDLQELRIASLLHDIGKVAIPESVLLKPGPLDWEEIEIVRQHPVVGENICAPFKSLRQILPVIRHHHERMDGSGYPDSLSGDEIPLKARIIQIVDIYDALTTARPYRQALSTEGALEILHQEAGCGWLDTSLVWKFSRICQTGKYIPVRGRSMLASYYA